MRIRLFAILAILGFHSNSFAKDFYISPLGSDAWDGLQAQKGLAAGSGPFRSLSRAQAAVRDLKKNGQFTEAVTVHIEGGNYSLPAALSFDLRDTGFSDRPIRWQGENGKVTISGGIELKSCQTVNAGRWRCATNGLGLDKIKYPNADRKRGNIPGFELFVNNQRLELARWPNNDWAHIRQPLNEKTDFSSLERLPPINAQSQGVQVHIMAGNDWYDQYLPVKTVNGAQNQIALSANTTYALASGRRYYLRNNESWLDAPGEWYYKAAGNYIDFIPPAGTLPNSVIVSAAPNLLQIKGAKHLTFSGIAFAHSTDIAINVSQSSHLSFDRIEISNVGGRGIEARDSDNVSIANSHIHHTGDGGVLATGGDRKTLVASANVVTNNHIHHVGRTVLTYTPGIQLIGVGGEASHNLIEYAGGEAIEFLGNDHLLEKNEIHHVCEQASDCGAIYTGRDWTFRGNVVRYNSIHDVLGYGLAGIDLKNNRVLYTKPNGARGMYLDDAVSGITIYGNLFNNAGDMAIQLGGGRDNIIENNVIATNGGYAIWVDNRWPEFNWTQLTKNLNQVPYQSSAWVGKYPQLAAPMNNFKWPEGNTIRRNVVIAQQGGKPALLYQMPVTDNTIASNLVWSNGGSILVNYNVLDHLKQGSVAPWQTWVEEGVEKNSINADPCATVQGNTVTFCANSPVNQIGFEVLPNDMGLIR